MNKSTQIASTTLLLFLAFGGWWFLLTASKKIDQKSKLLLVVDDLDRCEPDQMLAVIESLRMFLDDPAMSSRLQIMMLLDLRALELALEKRCRCHKVPQNRRKDYILEQREKWFVTELALPPFPMGTSRKPSKRSSPERSRQLAGRQKNPDSRHLRRLLRNPEDQRLQPPPPRQIRTPNRN
jgi:hypothetical protein